MSATAITKVKDAKFLGVIVDETLSWDTRIKVMENKISKNLGILYKARPFLNSSSLKTLYFSFIHSYLNYCNIAWGSTNFCRLEKLYSKQKHACRIICNENRYTSAKPLMIKNGILNVYQLNIYQVLVLMYKIIHGTSPTIFRNKIKKLENRYSTRYSKFNYKIPLFKQKSSTFAFIYRAPYLWNSILDTNIKICKTPIRFSKLLKTFLLQNETDLHCYF